MIYGVNFNGTQIPDGYKLKFADKRPIYECANCGLKTLNKDTEDDCGASAFRRYKPKGERGIARLQGVAESEAEARRMHMQANNGHRLVFVVRRSTAGPILYGVYCY